MKTDKRFYLLVNLVFVLLIVTGSFLVLPPSKDFGDQPSQDALLLGKLVEYNQTDFQGTFTEYYKKIWRDFYREKLDRNNPLNNYSKNVTPQNKYGLDEDFHGITSQVRVKALSRMLSLASHYVSFKMLDMETGFVLTGLIILLATYLYAYLLGKEVASPIFGTALAVTVTSNVYFNQLIRAYMENQTLLYPLLYCMCFYYSLRLHNAGNIRKLSSIMGLGFGISFAITNGYPNTLAILIPGVILYSAVLCINSYLGDRKYRRTTLVNYTLVILTAAYFTFLFSAAWSKLLGEDVFYHLSMLGDRFDVILMGGTINATFFQSKTLTSFIATFSNFFTALFTGSFFYNAPHEPSCFFRQGFFNVLENIFFVTGLLVLAGNLFKRTTLNIFMLFNLAVLIVRALSDLNISAGKGNYDYFFLAHLFVSYGIYFLVTNSALQHRAVNVFNRIVNVDKQRDNRGLKTNGWRNKFSVEKALLCFLLCIILVINMYNFNRNFVYSQNENLGYHAGLYELRRFIKNEVDKEKNLLILDWRWGDVFYFDTVTFVSGRYQFDTLDNLKARFDTPDSMKAALWNGTYSAIYIVVPGPVATIGGKHWAHGGHKRYNTGFNLSEYICPANTYRTIKDRQGKPVFYIHKITKEAAGYNILKINSAKKFELWESQLPSGFCLDYLYFPGSIDRAELKCNAGSIIIDLPKISYDYFLFSFDEKSRLEIYNRFNLKDKAVVSADNLKVEPPNDQRPNQRHLFTSVDKASLDFKYEFGGFPIHEVLLNVPYAMYHDRGRINRVSVQWKTEEDSVWKDFGKDISRGTEKYGTWKWMPPEDLYNTALEPAKYIDSFAGIIDADGADQLYLRYNIAKRMYGYEYGVRFIAVPYNPPEGNPNFMIFTLDTSKYREFARNCRNKVVLRVSYKDSANPSSSPSQSFIGIGIRQIPAS